MECGYFKFLLSIYKMNVILVFFTTLKLTLNVCGGSLQLMFISLLNFENSFGSVENAYIHRIVFCISYKLEQGII